MEEFKLNEKEKLEIEQKLEKKIQRIHRNTTPLKKKKAKTKPTTTSQLDQDFSNFCTKLSEALYLKGLRKIKYLTLIPEIIYYFIKSTIGVVSFVNNYEPLTILFSSIRGLSKDERQEFINNVNAHTCREKCEKCGAKGKEKCEKGEEE